MELKDLLPLLTLADTATMADAIAAVKNQNDALVQLRADNQKIADELAALKTANATAKIVNLVDAAVTEKKITAAEKPHFEKLAAADFATTEALLAGMKPYESIEQKLTDTDVNAAELAELIKLSGEDLFNEGKLERLKVLSPVQYKLKYKDAFGEEPKA